MFNGSMVNQILVDPICRSSQKLIIISGYATPTMASWHIKHISERNLGPIDITLIVGMCGYDGLTIDAHKGFRQLDSAEQGYGFSKLSCQYVYQGFPVHTKLYLWMKNGMPSEAFTGSVNYTQAGFSLSRREYAVPCDPGEAFRYFKDVEKDTIYCNHAEVEDHIILRPSHSVLEAESDPISVLQGAGVKCVTLSLLTRYGETGYGSGVNWGHRRNGIPREPNQAYIGVPAAVARSGFFPLEKQHFSVITDDSKQLILRVEQENDKAITTPLNNSLLGEYFRNRIGLPNGAFVNRGDLEKYGRTDVTFYKLDDEHFFMDFHV